MAEILVRDIAPTVVERLKERARRNGHSLEGEVKTILARSANEEKLSMSAFRKICDEIRSGFKGREFPDSTELIREERDR